MGRSERKSGSERTGEGSAKPGEEKWEGANAKAEAREREREMKMTVGVKAKATCGGGYII